VGLKWVRLVRRPLCVLLYRPRMMDCDECRAVCEMAIGRGNRSTRREPTAMSLCPPQVSHDMETGSNPGRRGGKPALTSTNRMCYAVCSDMPCAAHLKLLSCSTYICENPISRAWVWFLLDARWVCFRFTERAVHSPMWSHGTRHGTLPFMAHNTSRPPLSREYA
jgi:hypothetical protein